MLQREIGATPSSLHSCLLDGLCVSVLLIGHRFAVSALTHTSALTLMLHLFTTCLKPHHTLWCGCSARGKRKSVHGGLVAVGLAGGQTFGALYEPLWFLLGPLLPPHFTCSLSLCLSISLFSASCLTNLPAPLFYQGHQISHIINRKCELGNLMSRKVERQTFYCCLRTDFKSTSSIKKE